MKITNLFFALILFALIACSDDDSTTLPPATGGGTTTTIDSGNDPHFKIVPNTDGQFSNFNRKVVVFGIDIYAAPKVEDAKLLHAANIMAQYLDNDENGDVDNQLVLDKMIENKAFLFLWNTESDYPAGGPGNRLGQDLGNDETVPGFVANGRTGRFDASLEEVFHLITNAGYEFAYPDVFGTGVGTSMSNAMDIARGGQFMTIPNPYPAEAWYSYDDQTCDYTCMAGEYIYWVVTSVLGAQDNRLDEIGHEWKLNTKEKVQMTDVAAYELVSNPVYKFPTVLPDGTYMR